MSNSPIHLLLVEDDEVDVELIERALRTAGPRFHLSVAPNGVEALKQLRHGNGYSVEDPRLILLDLNMPLMNGLDFLRSLRGDPQLHHNIVFVLTSSNLDADKLAAYEQNVAGYLLKASIGEDTQRLVKLLDIYCRTVRFPTALAAC